MEIELFGEIVLVVFQRIPVDKRVSSGVGSQGVTTLKSKQSFLLIESAACPPPPLHTDTYCIWAQADQVAEPERVGCGKGLKTFTHSVTIGATREESSCECRVWNNSGNGLA